MDLLTRKSLAHKPDRASSSEEAVRPTFCPNATQRAPYAAGNMAIQRLLRSDAIQTKLTVGVPGDIYEREADQVAEHMMSSTDATSIQRKCSSCSHGTPCPTCDEDQIAQPKQRPGQTVPTSSKLETHHAELRGGGQALPATVRGFFEARFQRDFSGVRIHTNQKAAESAESINARAYTLGNDITFGAGQYEFGTHSGRLLLAHELTHVVQQDSASLRSAGNSAPVLQRDPNGNAGADTPIAPPPEHAERVARIDEMLVDIDQKNREREDLQAQFRALPEESSEETEAQRNSLRSALTGTEETLVLMLEDRIAYINQAFNALAELTKSSPSLPAGPKQSVPEVAKPPKGYSVQSEMYWLDQYRRENEAQLLVLKRCLARKRIKAIEAELATLPAVGTGERETLEKEKAEQIDYLEKSAAQVSCVKSPSETKHPTSVSRPALEKMKVGEGFVGFPYVALEGEKTGKGGCTIGFGHVITARDGRTCEHEPAPAPQPAESESTGEPGSTEPKKTAKKALRRCICTPPWSMNRESQEAEELLQQDISDHIKWIKEHVLVDLDQGQFDALVDISLHVGSVPKSLLDVVHAKLCTDDEAVRQQYLKTALTIKDNPERGPVFAKRRKERVWAPKADQDPSCI